MVTSADVFGIHRRAVFAVKKTHTISYQNGTKIGDGGDTVVCEGLQSIAHGLLFHTYRLQPIGVEFTQLFQQLWTPSVQLVTSIRSYRRSKNKLTSRLQAAVKDGYLRSSSKASRYRRSDKDKPCASKPTVKQQENKSEPTVNYKPHPKIRYGVAY